jgi:hypothetical protein
MKKYAIITIVLLAIAAACTILRQHAIINKIREEREVYKMNTEALMKDVTSYKVSDSLNAAKVGALKLTLDEYKKYRPGDVSVIKTLKVKHRDLQSATTASMVTSGQITGIIKDSTYVPPDCTVVKTIRCVDIQDNWFSLRGCENEKGQFDGEYTSKDSLIIVVTVQYKRFLNFLWKTNKIKNREVDIVSKNPHTKITGFEYIEIEK